MVRKGPLWPQPLPQACRAGTERAAFQVEEVRGGCPQTQHSLVSLADRLQDSGIQVSWLSRERPCEP